MREVKPDSLFTTSLSDAHSTIAVERDPATGKLLGFNEVSTVRAIVAFTCQAHSRSNFNFIANNI